MMIIIMMITIITINNNDNDDNNNDDDNNKNNNDDNDDDDNDDDDDDDDNNNNNNKHFGTSVFNLISLIHISRVWPNEQQKFILFNTLKINTTLQQLTNCHQNVSMLWKYILQREQKW